KTRLDEQLDLPLIAEARGDAAPTGRIDAGEQAATSGDARPLECHFLPDDPAVEPRPPLIAAESLRLRVVDLTESRHKQRTHAAVSRIGPTVKAVEYGGPRRDGAAAAHGRPNNLLDVEVRADISPDRRREHVVLRRTFVRLFGRVQLGIEHEAV